MKKDNNFNATTLRELWEWSNIKSQFSKRLKLWDKKLYHLDDEMLYYIIMRSESILNNRAERLRQDEKIS